MVKNIRWNEVKDYFNGDEVLRDIYFLPVNIKLLHSFINELMKSDNLLQYYFEEEKKYFGT